MASDARRRRAMRRALALFVVLVAHARVARSAGPLEVSPVEGGTWLSQIAALQAATTGPHASFHVRVVDGDTRRAVPCGQYALQLDARGSQALAVGSCDPGTGATEIVLVNRAAMFAPGDPVAPVPIAVSAYAVRLGSASLASGVEFHCMAWVRAYVADLLDGHPVYLTPERYAIEPLDGRLHAVLARDGWVISSQDGVASTDVAFRIVDVVDGREVARRRVAMQCAMTTETERGSPLGVMLSPLRLPAGAVGRGVTDGAVANRLVCTRSDAPTVVWRYTAPRDGMYEFLLQGGYQTALEVRPAGSDTESLGCSHGERIAHARARGRSAGSR